MNIGALRSSRGRGPTNDAYSGDPEVFEAPRISDADAESNVEWNRQRWGQPAGWTDQDQFGYRWGKGIQQTAGDVAARADQLFRPWTQNRYNLRILEIAPGAGRFTAELIRYAGELVLVDLNEAAIETCRQRFRYYPTPITYLTTTGRSLDMVPGGEFDVIACYDSMVHMHPEIIESYVSQLSRMLAVGGFAWLDHSGKGRRDLGHRSDMTTSMMRAFAKEAGLIVETQVFRNSWDCISVLRKP
jgi:SAM-dependent methyltransferase